MNNIQHLKYAVEVEKAGSISKAAENLFIAQPHLSKAIRELESSLGAAVFNRTSRGVVPTKKGREFLRYAKNILAQIEEMEALYKPANVEAQRFDICVPRASYISFAFTEFVKELDHEKDIDVNYRETNSMRAIREVTDGTNNLAVIRYEALHESYFLNALEERDLQYEPVWEFEYLALMSAEHPLAKEDVIDFSQLSQYMELVHGDISVPALPISEARQMARMPDHRKKIAVYERGSQFELLIRIPTTYIWASPMPRDVLERFSLVQKPCDMARNKYKDTLIYRKGYRMCDEDRLFIQKLHEAVRMVSEF